MKIPTSLFLPCGLLLAAILACSNPLSRFSKQYKCKVDGKPEPTTADEYLKRSSEHFDAQELDCALGGCEEALRLEPKNAHAYRCRGVVKAQLGKYQEGLDDLTEAIRLAPNEPQFYWNRSILYKNLTQPEKELEDLNKAIEISPKNQDSAYYFLARGEYYQRLKDFDKAINDLTQAINFRPTHAFFYDQRGEAYFEMADYDRAVKDYTSAIQFAVAAKDSEMAPYYYRDRAEAYRKLMQDELALRDEAAAKNIEDGGSFETAEGPVADRTAKHSTPISAGVLNGKALSLPKPAYPPIAKSAQASGTVTVQVVVNEDGRVIEASAVSGHPLLRAASVAAARQATFTPAKLSGRAVKMTGVLIYKFEAE